jgi:hypothetical protein
MCREINANLHCILKRQFNAPQTRNCQSEKSRLAFTAIEHEIDVMRNLSARTEKGDARLRHPHRGHGGFNDQDFWRVRRRRLEQVLHVQFPYKSLQPANR